MNNIYDIIRENKDYLKTKVIGLYEQNLDNRKKFPNVYLNEIDDQYKAMVRTEIAIELSKLSCYNQLEIVEFVENADIDDLVSYIINQK